MLSGGVPVAAMRMARLPASVGHVRLLVDDALTENDVTDRSLVDAAVLLASELATDGVRHGTGEHLDVELSLGPRRVQLTVVTAAARRPGEVAPALAEHSERLLDMIAEAWDVRVAGGTRTAWYRLDR
jgi:hypothetical protein